jgi:hypothetical protein
VTVSLVRDPNVRRRGIVYGFDILRPATGDTRVDYVGQTVRPLAVREAEHRGLGRDPSCEQPWSDLIVGRAFVVEEGWWTCAELDERERFHIARLQPVYNHEANLNNPYRVPIFEARRQRDARDAARGVASRNWGAPPPVVSLRRPPSRPVSRRPPARPVSRRVQRVRRFAAGWLAVAVLLFVAVMRGAPDVPPGYGAAGSGVVALWMVWGVRDRALAVRRRWRRMWR